MEAALEKKLTEMGQAWEDFKGAHATLKEEVAKLGREDVVLKEHITKASETVSTLHEELTKKYDELATKMNRVDTAFNDDNPEKKKKKFAKEAKKFMKTVLCAKGDYKIGNSIPDSAVEDYRGFLNVLPKLIRKGDKVLTQDETKALSVGTDLDGGFFIRPVWANRIIKKIFETSPMRQISTVETVSGPELKFPVDVGLADCGWVAETQSRAVTATPPIQEKSIVAQEMYALPKATQSLLEDAGVDVEAWLMDKVALKMALTEATAFVVGTGIGQPRGILTYPNGLQWGQVQQVGSGSSGLFTVTGLTQLQGQLKEDYHTGSQWLMRRESVPGIMLLQDGAGRYIFQPIFSLGFYSSPLLGYPITYAHDFPLAAPGALAAAFGNFRTAYTVVDRLGITMLRDPYLYKPFIGFYTRKRVGGDVLNFEAYKIQVLS